MTNQHDDDRQRKVSERAYARWEAEGRPEGRHEQHWHDATREIDEAAPAAAPDAPPAAVKRRRSPPKDTAPAAESPAKRPRQPRPAKAKKD